MVCSTCGAESIGGKRFCADCGSPLQSGDSQLHDEVLPIVIQELRRRDQKILERETADAIVADVWVDIKRALWGGVIVLIILGAFGLKEYKDALRAISSTGEQAVNSLRSQASQAEQNLSGEGTKQKHAIENTAAMEIAGVKSEAEEIRQRYARFGNDAEIQSARKQADARLQAEIAHVKELEKAGNELKDRYEQTGKQLAQLQAPNQLFLPLVSSTAANLPGTLSSPTLKDGGVFINPSESLKLTDQVSTLVKSSPALRFYSLGSKGPDVERIQQKLLELGCFEGTVSGNYDEMTQRAVMKFNTARHAVFSSNLVDASTWDALFGTNESGLYLTSLPSRPRCN